VPVLLAAVVAVALGLAPVRSRTDEPAQMGAGEVAGGDAAGAGSVDVAGANQGGSECGR